MNKFFTVLGHTYFSRLKSKSFLISTAIILVLITVAANLETIIDFFVSDDEEKIIVIDEKEQYFSMLEQQVMETEEGIELVLYKDSEDKGKEAVQNGDFEGLLTLTYADAGFPEATYYENSGVESWNQMMLEQHLQQIKVAIATEQSGIDQATLE